MANSSTPSPLVKPILNRIPLIGPLLKSNSRMKMFTPAEKKALDGQYREALGLGDKATFSDSAFDVLSQESLRDISQFSKTKTPDGGTILEKLNAKFENDDKEIVKQHKKNVAFVKNSIKKALEPTPEFIKAQQDYKDSVTAFKELVKKVPQEIRAEALINLMAEIQDEAIKSIEDQYKKEKDDIEALFKDNHFNEASTESLDLAGKPDLNVVKTNLLKDVEESHKKHLDEFKKTTSGSLNLLQKAAAAQNNELIFINNLHKNNKNARAEIQRIAEQKRAQQISEGNLSPQGSMVRIGIGNDRVAISGVTVADLPLIKSITGKDIKQKAPGEFEVEFSNSIFDFFYNQDPRQNHLTDMTLMAEAVKAGGGESIIFDVDVEPEEVALERARQAYEGAINAGFYAQKIPKPEKGKDNIVINVGGKPMRVDELFKEDQSRLQAIHQKANSIKEELKDFNEFKPGSVDTTSARRKMQELKGQYEEQRLEQEQEQEQEQEEDLELDQNNNDNIPFNF